MSKKHQFAKVFNKNSRRCFGDDYDSDWTPEEFDFKWKDFDRRKKDFVLDSPPKIRRIGKDVLRRKILKASQSISNADVCVDVHPNVDSNQL